MLIVNFFVSTDLFTSEVRNNGQKSRLHCLAENFLHLNEGKTKRMISGDASTSDFGTLTSKCQEPRGDV